MITLIESYEGKAAWLFFCFNSNGLQGLNFALAAFRALCLQERRQEWSRQNQSEYDEPVQIFHSLKAVANTLCFV